jgi:hypothetical protein
VAASAEAWFGLGGVTLGAAATLGASFFTARHERIMDRERRTQVRRGETYVTLMAYVNWASLYAEQRKAECGDQSVPILEAPENAGAIAAPVLTYAAVPVVIQLRKLLAAVQALDAASVEVQGQRRAGTMPSTDDLNRAADEVIRASDDLRNIIRVDLGEEALPPGF